MQRKRREHEVEARRLAFKAARLMQEEKISQADAIARVGSNRYLISQAVLILQHGTAVEIAAGESGEVSIATIHEDILSRTTREYKAPVNRIENSDVEQAYRDNPGIARAAERAHKLRGIGNPGLIAFFYYILTNRNPDLAERMIHTLENPAGVGLNDPFFRLRQYFISDYTRKDGLVTIALMIKASNAASEGREVKALTWRNQGSVPEPFPTLDVTQADLHYR